MKTLQEFADEKRTAAGKIPAGILERWQSRVVTRGLHQMGRDGANQYILDYGRGIKVSKVVDLARQAESEGAVEMAAEFWRRAYEMENGCPPPDGNSVAPVPAAGSPVPRVQEKYSVEGLPSHLMPGSILTMQPVDAPHEREAYVHDLGYLGQKKIDGRRLVAVVSPEQVYYQARSTNLQGPPSVEIDRVLRAAAAEFGTFVLDSELYYPDAVGGEHRTGAQAATANIAMGQANVHPQATVAIFRALYFRGEDLTALPERERYEASREIGLWLEQRSSAFQLLRYAVTPDEKQALIDCQQAEGREGEVWTLADTPYVGGKQTGARPRTVRTKYIREISAVVLSLSKTDAVGRLFGSAEVGVYEGGQLISLGSITGFDQRDMARLAQRHAETPGQVVILVATQGLTEAGKVMHGRFAGFCDDKAPQECVLE